MTKPKQRTVGKDSKHADSCDCYPCRRIRQIDRQIGEIDKMIGSIDAVLIGSFGGLALVALVFLAAYFWMNYA